MATQQRGKALYRVRELESPIHKEFRGLRVEVTLPNMAGQKPFSDITVPSFDRPYFVCMFGDYETWEALHMKWGSICKAIYRMGFEEIVQYKPEDYGPNAQREETGQEDKDKESDKDVHFTPGLEDPDEVGLLRPVDQEP